jgi:RNA polymerase sigma-70 factor, ECF subfamily
MVVGASAEERDRGAARVDEKAWQVAQFERQRPQLQAVAYRMLGSRADAEDAVQETWVRLSRSGDDAIANMGGWLVTVVGRVCIDMLRARRARREDQVGIWLPEPETGAEDAGGPEQQSVLADSVGLALLVVLDTLSPPERLAFVLHDMFGMPFEEIAPIVERTPAATRQLASRARRSVRGAPTVSAPDLGTQRKVVAAFLAAARAGDFEGLVAVLAPDVALRIEAGSRAWAGPALVTGAAPVARHAVTHGRRWASVCRPALVNGGAGVLARGRAGAIAVAGLTVVGGRIATIDLILDPDRLAAMSIGDDV